MESYHGMHISKKLSNPDWTAASIVYGLCWEISSTLLFRDREPSASRDETV
jgi:hypothetical protein